VVRDVLSAPELAALNGAVDAHHGELQVIGRDTVSKDARTGRPEAGAQGTVLSQGSEALRGSTGRGILGWDGSSNMLGWEPRHREGFRDLLVHPRIVGILNSLLGQGFRLVRPRHRRLARLAPQAPRAARRTTAWASSRWSTGPRARPCTAPPGRTSTPTNTTSSGTASFTMASSPSCGSSPTSPPARAASAS